MVETLDTTPQFLQREEIVRNLEPVVKDNLVMLLDPNKAWQPSQLLPDFGSYGWEDQVRALQKQAALISSSLLVCFVAHTVTEENVVHYVPKYSRYRVMADLTGTDEHPFELLGRWWGGEENRHGDVSMEYLRLGGRVNMYAVERTVQHMIRNGFNMNISDPLEFFIYTANQEWKTRVAHSNTGRLAMQQGDSTLAKICLTISQDEGRHEGIFTNLIGAAFVLEPTVTMVAFRDMMRKSVIMPTKLIEDGVTGSTTRNPKLFLRYARVAESIGVFSLQEDANALSHFMEVWDIDHRQVSAEGDEAREDLHKILIEYQERADQRKKRSNVLTIDPSGFSWLKR